MNKHILKTLILRPSDVQQIIQYVGPDTLMDILIQRMFHSFESFDDQETIIPIRSGFNYEKPTVGLVEWMPLYKQGEQVVIKIVGYHPNNPEKYGLPTIVSTISAYDTSTGHLSGLTDGVLLTALRTGAASAVASQLLAHPDSAVLGLIGCGAQAVTQLHALSRIFKLKKVFFYDIDPEVVQSFPDRCAALDLDLVFVPTNIKEVVRQAEILCTATSIDVGAGPLFELLETQPTLHVNAVGSDFPGKTELPKSLLEKSFVCPDFLEQAVKEGECQQLSAEHIGPSILDVIRNREQYTYVQNQRSVFDSTGWALEDQVVMDLFLEYATELGLGLEVAIESVQEDAKNPYHFLNKVAAPSFSQPS
ncbi:MAG: ornithine cyclodeaminase family protein [Saprospiraceae bacterium]